MAKTITYLNEVPVSGPLAPLAGEFKATLAEDGYPVQSARRHLWLMAHLGRWMEDRALGVSDLDGERVEGFLADRRAAGYRTFRSVRALVPLLDFLRAKGLVERVDPSGPVEELLAGFGRYLADERAVVPSTVHLYGKRARRFLARCAPDGDVGQLVASDVTEAVVAECEALSAGSAQYFVSALRSFLRFCYLEGRTEVDLSVVALWVTGRRRSWLPRGMSAGDVRALLATCDRRRSAGRRDYAIFLLLARLGLRAGEVARLQLEDIDWRAGELIVSGKGGRQDRLPLPADVGEAIVAYLQRGRPPAGCREVFVSLSAPIRGLGYMAVSGLVRRSCRRAGVEPVGAHRLRHALAVDLVAAGASLPEVGQILRHQSISTTSVYARVDLAALRAVAQPWPAGAGR